MLGTFFQQLYNTVDAIVVGNYVGKEALAAVGGSTGTTISLLVNFVVGLTGGATVVIAQSYGAYDREGIKKGVTSGMFLGISLGAILMVVGILLAPNLLRILKVPSDMFPLAVSYMRIYLLGTVPVMIYNVGAGVLRAVGDSKRPLYFLIVSCVVNIILDVVLVANFNLGVNGAAIATIVSQIASAILVLYVLGNREAPYYYNLKKDFYYQKDTLKRIIIIGLPMGIQSVLYSVSNLFIQAQINSYGTDTIAAFTAFGKIDAIYWMISGAFGSAAVTMIGQCFGAGKIERAKKACTSAIVLDLIFTVAITLICCFAGNYLYNMFTNDQKVIEIGMEILMAVAPYWFTFVLIEILSSAIRACGESFRPMMFTAIGICLLRMLWILFYPSKSVSQTLMCYPISWIITSAMFVVYYIKGNWIKKNDLKSQKNIK